MTSSRRVNAVQNITTTSQHWIQRNYSVHAFCQLISENVVHVPRSWHDHFTPNASSHNSLHLLNWNAGKISQAKTRNTSVFSLPELYWEAQQRNIFAMWQVKQSAIFWLSLSVACCGDKFKSLVIIRQRRDITISSTSHQKRKMRSCFCAFVIELKQQTAPRRLACNNCIPLVE